ncbi:MAG: peroxidase [Bacteroidetes bacterium]|nr:peroxidase [Bacteroidota bacterium]
MKIRYTFFLLLLMVCACGPANQPGDDDETPLLPETQTTRFILKASNGNYFVIGNEFCLTANQPDAARAEEFEKTEMPNGKFALKASNGKFICSDREKNGLLIVNRDFPGEWETFDITVNQGKATIKSSAGKFACADQSKGDIVIANRDSAGEWETFTLEFSKK